MGETESDTCLETYKYWPSLRNPRNQNIIIPKKSQQEPPSLIDSFSITMPNTQSSHNENGSKDRKDFKQAKPDQEGRDTSINAEDGKATKKDAAKDIHANTEDLAKVMYGTQSFGV